MKMTKGFFSLLIHFTIEGRKNGLVVMQLGNRELFELTEHFASERATN